MTECELDKAAGQLRCDDIFRDIEAQFQVSQISNDKWYLTALSALTTTRNLTYQEAYSTADPRRTLIQRLRETLFKDIILVGLPRPSEALVAISRVEHEGEVEQTFTCEGWQCDKMYAHNATAVFDLFQRHRDWEFWVGEIAYGLHLSDRQMRKWWSYQQLWDRIYHGKHIGIFEGLEEWVFLNKMSRWYVIVYEQCLVSVE
ncbi:hypothetical protein N7490_004341 [Penicillium lividum]|nr:hypothetical protein N7490_004341 [Penicillium lividum]